MPRLDVYKEAFDGDEKYMLPFPSRKYLLVMLKITIGTSYMGNLIWGESMPIFNQGMEITSLETCIFPSVKTPNCNLCWLSFVVFIRLCYQMVWFDNLL